MRPIPVDIIPSHAHLSQKDQIKLFGSGYAMTVAANLSQIGQYACEETVQVFGKLKRSLKLHVLGPNWDNSHVEVTMTEAQFLGLNVLEVLSGKLDQAKPCEILGSKGKVKLENGLIVTRPHLLCSPKDAQSLNISNQQEIDIELLTDTVQILKNVIVRIHPTYQLRVELNQDYAREYWITKSIYARLIEK